MPRRIGRRSRRRALGGGSVVRRLLGRRRGSFVIGVSATVVRTGEGRGDVPYSRRRRQRGGYRQARSRRCGRARGDLVVSA